MAGRDEIVDAIAGFALFADLTTPQLEAVAHIFEERWFPEGERVLRQGLTGSGFYVILDGACSIQVDGQERATLGRGEFFGEVSILLGESPVADVVAQTPLRCLVLAGPGRRGVPDRSSPGDVPDAPGVGPPSSEREPVAELSDRPFPPGDYPVVVVGSGPGGLQVSYSLRRQGVPHAVISADDAPGGMFRRWPFFQRLLSWTKPYAPFPAVSRAYERYDWNSLIPEEDEHRALQPTFMDGSSYFPSRPEMEAGLVAFAQRTGIAVRFDCRWQSTRRLDDGRFELTTSDGPYRSGTVILAVGVAEPWAPPTPGIELAAHYAETRPVETYADRRIFIIGKQNSGFELASGFLPWAKRIVIASPSPAKLSVQTHSLVGIRARYLQPYEDHVLGGGVAVLDASIEAIERLPGWSRPAGPGAPVRRGGGDGVRGR